jgi:predicted RNase H-like HicB family nuclease
MSKYDVHIWWSEADSSYIAQAPDLPGCLADGNTYDEALKNLEIVIAEWIETARSLGRTIPIPSNQYKMAA